MRNNHRTIMRTVVFTSLLVLGLVGYVMAKTPDGETPAEETVCDGLSGAAFGLCNAYCEAEDCDVLAPERNSCERLRRNFERVMGTPIFPCDPFCGDGVTDTGETCDTGAGNSDAPDAPSGCRTDCSLLRCGDGVTDSGETCDDGDDGVAFGGENCPSGNCNDPDASCRTDCTPQRCGDDIVDSGETCDGTDVSACVFPASNGCNDPNSPAPTVQCTCSTCGDSVIDAPLETCEPPSSGLCSKHCLLPAIALFDTGNPLGSPTNVSTSFTISKGLLGPGTILPIGPQSGIFPLVVGPDLPGTGGVQSMVPLPTALAPINVLGAATACVFILPLDPNDPNGIPPPFPGAAGIGWLDCMGSPGPNAGLGALGLPTDPNFSIYVDHCTGLRAPDPNQIFAPNPACDSNPVAVFDPGDACVPGGGPLITAYSGGSGTIDDSFSVGTGLCVPEQTTVDVGCVIGTPDAFAGQFGNFGNAHGFQDPQNPGCVGAGTGLAPFGTGIPLGSAFVFFNLALDVRGVTDPNDLACVPPTRTPPNVTPFTTGTARSGIMDAFASKGATQSLFGSGSPFSCPGILFGGPVAPGAVLFSSTPVIDSTESGPSPTDVNRGTSYIAQ